MKKIYEIIVELKSPMLISSGVNDNSVVNSSYVIDDKKRPFIPGSTIKGIVRANFSAIVDDEKCKGDNCNCAVCSLFGSGGYNPSRIYFSDLNLQEDEYEKNIKITSIRYHNSINRFLKKTNNKGLFSEQVVEKGIFKGICEVYLNEDTKEHINELCVAIKMIENIGSSKSRGYGFANINLKEVN